MDKELIKFIKTKSQCLKKIKSKLFKIYRLIVMKLLHIAIYRFSALIHCLSKLNFNYLLYKKISKLIIISISNIIGTY